MAIWILVILLIGVSIYFSGCKFTPTPPIDPPDDPPEPPEPPEPIPDPNKHKWQMVKTDTPRWAEYFAYMQRITTDTRMAQEMMKTDATGKKFYVWTAEVGDYWDLPDEVWEKGKVDCDGFARLTADGLGRFAQFPEVWWLEYYGYYRYYFLKDDKWQYTIELGGHAITVYKKDGKLLAFSNTNWLWNKDFQDFVEIGENTFPEGIVLIRCRHWDTGVLQWVQEAEGDEILEGSCIFDRSKIVEGKKSDRKKLVI